MSMRDWWIPVRHSPPRTESPALPGEFDVGGTAPGGEHIDDLDHPSVAELLFGVIEARGDLVWSMMGKEDEGRLTLGLVRCPPQELAVLVDDHDRLVGLRLSRRQAQEMHRMRTLPLRAVPVARFDRRRTVQGVVLAAAEIALSTAVVAALQQVVSVHALAALYVLTVLPIATGWGLWPALAVAVVSTFTFNFVFIPPLFVLTPMDAETLAILVISVVIAIVVSELAGRAQRRTREAESLARDVRRFAEEQSALRRVATLVARGVAPEETFSSVAAEVGRLFGPDVAVVLRFEPKRTATVVGSWTVPGVVYPEGARLTVEGVGAAVTVLESSRPTRAERFEGPPGSVADSFTQVGARAGVGAPILLRRFDHLVDHHQPPLPRQPFPGASKRTRPGQPSCRRCRRRRSDRHGRGGGAMSIER
jgi:hypothetical protein